MAKPGLGRKALYLNTLNVSQAALNVPQRALACAMFELVGFVEEHAHWNRGFAGPIEQLGVEGLQWMANVHDQDDGDQVVPKRQIFIDRMLPGELRGPLGFGVAVTRQIDEATATAHGKEIEQLRPPWGFADLCSLSGAGQAIEHAGLAAVRTASEGNFAALQWRTLAQGRCAFQETDFKSLRVWQVFCL